MADQYAPIVHQLEQDVSAIRIKKLILYACKNWWENDPDRLAAISLQSLVEELRYLYPSLAQLQYKLRIVVGTLNKQEEYSQVATLITEKLAALYVVRASTSEDVTMIRIPTKSIASDLQNQITAALAKDTNLSRIKKLMICSTRKYWETDSSKVDQIELRDLVGDLARLHPNLESLRMGLAVVVKNLSKPIEYAAIADSIVREMCRLYRDSSPESAAEATAIEIIPAKQPLSEEKGQPIDLFDLRLELMKYVNPLRAKILLFSVSYYDFECKQQDWSNLKLYSLEGLLRNVTTIGNSFAELQAKLQETAHRLNEPEEYAEVARVILKCLKPIYLELQQQVQNALSSSVADVTQAKTTQVLINEGRVQPYLNRLNQKA
jgi:hypothetical protein